MDPKVLKIKRLSGIAGQFQINAEVQYDDEPAEVVGFVGSVYGGGVVMITPTGHQTFVTDPGRFGSEFGEKWVRRFFGQEH